MEVLIATVLASVIFCSIVFYLVTSIIGTVRGLEEELDDEIKFRESLGITRTGRIKYQACERCGCVFIKAADMPPDIQEEIDNIKECSPCQERAFNRMCVEVLEQIEENEKEENEDVR